jgi:hypothetical protein
VLKKNQRFLLNLGALSLSLFLDFSQHVTDIILNEYSRNTENALLEWLGKEILILRNQNTRGFFSFEFSFRNYFWNVFNTSGLSQIFKIKNVWKLSIPFSSNALKNLLGV